MQVRPCLRERKERRDVKRGPCYSWERIKNWDKSWGSFIIGQKCPLRSKCTLFRKRSLPPGFWIAHLGENCLGVQARKKKKDREFQEWIWVTWNEVLLPFSVLYSFLDVLWCRAHVHDESSQFCKVDVECHCDGQLVVFLVGHIAPNCSWMALPAIWIPKSQAVEQCDFSPYGLRSNLPQKVILSDLCMRWYLNWRDVASS